MIKQICQYIKEQDRQLDALEIYQEFLDGEYTTGDMIEYLQEIMGDWKEELLTTNLITEKVKSYYTFLGI